jgi:hypothetical protein
VEPAGHVRPDVRIREDREKRRGGGGIAEAFRRAWSRLIRKQWLILYPIALVVINAAAFLAVYAADGGQLQWGSFLNAAFDRELFVHDHFLSGLSLTPALGVAIFAGLAVCALAAMIRAPYFRAITGHGYPRAPRSWSEIAQLSLFYLFANLALWVVPLAAPSQGALTQLVLFAALLVTILIAFADYAIVFEELAFVPALRRSFQLVRRRWIPVVVVIIVYQLVDLGLHSLYKLYYGGTNQVFVLLPLSQLLVDSLLVLFVDLLLIFLYEQARQAAQA